MGTIARAPRRVARLHHRRREPGGRCPDAVEPPRCRTGRSRLRGEPRLGHRRPDRVRRKPRGDADARGVRRPISAHAGARRCGTRLHGRPDRRHGVASRPGRPREPDRDEPRLGLRSLRRRRHTRRRQRAGHMPGHEHARRPRPRPDGRRAREAPVAERARHRRERRRQGLRHALPHRGAGDRRPRERGRRGVEEHCHGVRDPRRHHDVRDAALWPGCVEPALGDRDRARRPVRRRSVGGRDTGERPQQGSLRALPGVRGTAGSGALPAPDVSSVSRSAGARAQAGTGSGGRGGA